MKGQMFSADMIASLALFLVVFGLVFFAFDSVDRESKNAAAYSLLERETYQALQAIYTDLGNEGMLAENKVFRLFNSTNITEKYNLWSEYELQVLDSQGRVLEINGQELYYSTEGNKTENKPIIQSERKALLNGEIVSMRLKTWY